MSLLLLAPVSDTIVALVEYSVDGANGALDLSLLRRMINEALLQLPAPQTDTMTKISLLDAGADNVLCKPFHFQELGARPRALASRRTDSELCFHLRQVRIDLEDAGIRVGGTHLELSAPEFIVFDLLLRAAGRTITPGQISQSLGYGGRDGSLPNIYQTISRLRMKIAVITTGVIVRNERGFGYRIAPAAPD